MQRYRRWNSTSFILHPPSRPGIAEHESPYTSSEHPAPTRQPGWSSRQANHPPTPTNSPKKPQDHTSFLSELNVYSTRNCDYSTRDYCDVHAVGTLISTKRTYHLMHPKLPESSPTRLSRRLPPVRRKGQSVGESLLRGLSTSGAGTPGAESRDDMPSPSNIEAPSMSEGNYITPAFLSSILLRMREARLVDLAPSTLSAG